MIHRSNYLLWLVIGLTCTLTPFIGSTNGFISDAASELPVKLWCYSTFGAESFWGGWLDNVAFPHSGPLNNPDVFGTAWMMTIGTLMTESQAYNWMLVFIMALNVVSGMSLARCWTRSTPAIVLATIVFAWSPTLLSYAFAGAITDVAHVWPFPMAFAFVHQALWPLAKEERVIYWKAVAAGMLFGAGFIICPYNFVLFTPLAIPLLVWALFQYSTRSVLAILVTVGVVTAVITAPYAIHLSGLISDSSSQMSTTHLSNTRHQWPFPELHPGNKFTATLSGYFSYGPEALTQREAGARFFRAFSIPISVVTLLVLTTFRKGWGLWQWSSIFFLLLSLGPFIPLSEQIWLDKPVNLIWMSIFYFWPGSSLLLEPFRYAMVLYLCLGLGAAMGLASLKSARLSWLVVGVCAAELLLVSSTPFPLPRSAHHTENSYRIINQRLPPGALIEMPYHDFGTALFRRQHFLNQRLHQRPIPNILPGFVPAIFQENPFLNGLIRYELPHPIQQDSTETEAGIDTLLQQGFVAIVVTPSRYQNRQTAMKVEHRIKRNLGTADLSFPQQKVWLLDTSLRIDSLPD